MRSEPFYATALEGDDSDADTELLLGAEFGNQSPLKPGASPHLDNTEIFEKHMPDPMAVS